MISFRALCSFVGKRDNTLEINQQYMGTWGKVQGVWFR